MEMMCVVDFCAIVSSRHGSCGGSAAHGQTKEELDFGSKTVQSDYRGTVGLPRPRPHG